MSVFPPFKAVKPLLRKPAVCLFSGTLAFTSFAQAEPFAPATIEMDAHVIWAPSPLEKNLDLGAEMGLGNATDDWHIKIDFVDMSRMTERDGCNPEYCHPLVQAHQEVSDFSIEITSTSELDMSHPLLQTDRPFRPKDYFEWVVNLNNRNTGYIQLKDAFEGLFFDEEAGRTRLWEFERSLHTLHPGSIFEFTSAELARSYANSQNIPDITYHAIEQLYNVLDSEEFYRQGTVTMSNVKITWPGEAVAPALCRYEVVSEWAEGFTAFVYMKNMTAAPLVGGWSVAIDFADDVAINTHWSSQLSGNSSTVVATNMDWNATIYPGQEINFGFVGSKAPGQTAAASIASAICRRP